MRFRIVVLAVAVGLGAVMTSGSAGAATDGHAKAACKKVALVALSVGTTKHVDSLDRDLIAQATKELKKSKNRQAKAQVKGLAQARKAKLSKLDAKVTAFVAWCTRHHYVKSSKTSKAPKTTSTTVPPTTTPTTAPPDPAAIEFAYKSSAITPGYDELVKNPNGTGQPVYYRAKVFQFDTNTGPNAMLVEVTRGDYDFWSDNVLIKMPDAALGNGIDNDDIVDIWGDPSGAFTYDTKIGGSNTVPTVTAQYVSLVSKG